MSETDSPILNIIPLLKILYPLLTCYKECCIKLKKNTFFIEPNSHSRTKLFFSVYIIVKMITIVLTNGF